MSEVVYNWLQGGNKDGGAVYSQDAACCCSDCGQGYGCGEDRALCIVTTTTTTTTTTILVLQQCAQEDLLPGICSGSHSALQAEVSEEAVMF